MKRRALTTSFLFAASTLLWKRRLKICYKVRFYIDLMEQNEHEFHSLQSKYEDNQAIDQLSKHFEDKGWIVKTRVINKSDRTVSWIYYFKDETYFAKWESELYERRIVKKEGRPYNIYREADYALI